MPSVVAERIANRVRHDDRSGEMDDDVNPVFCDQRRYLRPVPAVTDDERRAPRDRPIEAGGEIVEHYHPLAGIDERMNHVAADIARPAGNQDRHAVRPLRSTASLLHRRRNLPPARECMRAL